MKQVMFAFFSVFMILGFAATVYADDDEAEILFIEDMDDAEGEMDIIGIAEGEAGDDAVWRLDENGCLTISGTGMLYDGCSYTDDDGTVYLSRWNVYQDDITSIIVEDGITGLAEDEFCHCINAETITIPDSVNSIDCNVFPISGSLQTIYFGGTKDHWNSIFTSSLPGGITVVCSDGEIVYKYDLLSVTLSQTSVTYNGTAQEPSATVISWDLPGRETTLTEGMDYDVSYANNTNAGTAVVTVTGKGNYTGTLEAAFTIKPASISKSTAVIKSGKTSYDYTGKSIKPEVVVTSSVTGNELTKGTDYTVVYSDNKNAGTATITITGKGNYKGTLKKAFTIKAVSIAKSKVEIDIDRSPYESGEDDGRWGYFYAGKAIKPAVLVTSSVTKKTLEKGTDYTVAYENNKNAGTATITVTGIGNYKGTAKTTFTIKPVSISKSKAVIKSGTTSFTYTGKAIKPAVTVTSSVTGKTLTRGTDYFVSYESNKNVGTAFIWISGKGNYCDEAAIELSFKIKPASISESTVAIKSGKTSYTFTGAAIKPVAVVTSSVTGKTLRSGTDYSVAYKNNKNVGTATITVTGKGNYKGTAKTTFTIGRANIKTFVKLKGDRFTYTGKPIEPKISSKLEKDVDYTVTYQNNTKTYTSGRTDILKNPPKPPCVIIKGIGNCKGTVKLEFDIWSRYHIYAKDHWISIDCAIPANVGDSFQLQLQRNKDGKIFSTEGGIWKIEETTQYYNDSAATITKSGYITALKEGNVLVSYTKDKEVTFQIIMIKKK